MARKPAKVITDELIGIFNDICMREMRLGVEDEYNRIYDIDSNNLIQFKGKFLTYYETKYDIIRNDEIQMNLLENPKIMQSLFQMYLNKISNITISMSASYGTNPLKGIPGRTVIKYVPTDNEDVPMIELSSDLFLNESVQMLNLICKLNGSAHMYQFDKFDIVNFA